MLLAVLVMLVIVPVAQAVPKWIPANEIERGVFIDPAVGRAKGGPTAESTETNTSYSYKGIRWANPFISYRVNTAGSGLDPAAARTAMDNSFLSWQDEVNVLGRGDQSYIFFINDGTAATSGPILDGHNTVGWGTLSSGTLAACYYWYDRRTKYLIEFDIVFNSLYPWSTSGEAGKYDVWNIGAHEAGHTLQLGDLYKSSTSELTMHGYGYAGETKKQSLGLGDMLGLEKIYSTYYPAP